MKKVLLVAAAVCALAVALPGAFAGGQATPGVTARTITIGGTFPLTGAASSYAPIADGMKAYFSYVNSRKGPDKKRGVGGRQIIFKIEDDGYNPVQTLQKTRELVESSNVYALVGSLGTEPVLAIRDYTNSKQVPLVYVSTGASYWGLQRGKYPWLIGWQPDYQSEAKIYGRRIATTEPNAKIAIIFQNDDYGKDYIEGFKAGLGSAQNRIVSERGFNVTDPSVATQVAGLRASGADTLMIFATPAKTIQTYATMRALGWKPENIYVNSVSATDTFMSTAVRLAGAATVNGSVSTQYLKDPANPEWDNDAGMKHYRALMAKYLPNATATNGLYLYGMAKAFDFVQLLYATHKADKTLARKNLMKAAANLTIRNNPFSLPTVETKTGKNDPFPISKQRLIRYNNGTWTAFGPIVEGR